MKLENCIFVERLMSFVTPSCFLKIKSDDLFAVGTMKLLREKVITEDNKPIRRDDNIILLIEIPKKVYHHIMNLHL